MKTKLIFLVTILSVQLLISQNYQTIEEVNDACASLGFSSNEDAEIAVDNILAQIGMFRNFTIQECPNINNAIAKNIDVGSGHKERYILYDQEFFTRIEDKAANDWTAISILAHEIGHHLYGHALNDEGSSHKWELEADDFSGFILARMGGSLEDAQSAINTLKLEKATRTHPAKADRLIAIEKGWNRGKGKIVIVTETKEEEVQDEVVISDEEEITEEDKAERKLQAQEIFRKHIKAIGSESDINGIKTLYQKYSLTKKNNLYDDIDISEAEMTYMSPSKYIIEDPKMYIMKIGGRIYQKINKKNKWELFINNSDAKGEISYVNELSYLVNNEDAYYLGIEDFNGVSCYAIGWPTTSSEKNIKVARMTFHRKAFSYYNIETGLLSGTKNIARTITVYKAKNMTDKDATRETINLQTDYREINGVLFPTKITTKIVAEESEYETITEYLEIVVNPEINPKDFKVKR